MAVQERNDELVDLLTPDFIRRLDEIINARIIRALTNDGLRIEDDAGNLGVFVEDGGHVGVGHDTPAYQLDTLVGAGAQNILRAGQTGISNGFVITSNGTVLTYTFVDGAVGIQQAAPNTNFRLHVGPGTDTPVSVGDVYIADNGSAILILRDCTNDVEGTYLVNSAGVSIGSNTNHDVTLRSNATTRATVNASGITLADTLAFIADTLKARDAGGVQIQDDGGNYGIFVEDGGQVGIGHATPAYLLDVLAAAGAQDVARFGQGGVSNGLVVVSNGSVITVTVNGVFAVTSTSTYAGSATFNAPVIYGRGADLTIASGVITVTHSYHRVDTQGGAATDDLDTINGGVEGQKLILRTVTGARDVVIKHNTGNIFLKGAADITLPNTAQVIELFFTGAVWADI